MEVLGGSRKFFFTRQEREEKNFWGGVFGLDRTSAFSDFGTCVNENYDKITGKYSPMRPPS